MEALSLHSNSSPLVTFQIQSPPRKSLTLNAEKNSISNKKSGGFDFLVPDNARGEGALFGDAKWRKSRFGSGFLCGCHSGSGGGRT
jgi:hypothetical protein